MLGYAKTQHAYRIFDLDSGEIAVSNNARFEESVSPFQTMSNVPRTIDLFGLSSSLQSSFSSVPGIRPTADIPGISTPPSSPELEVVDTLWMMPLIFLLSSCPLRILHEVLLSSLKRLLSL